VKKVFYPPAALVEIIRRHAKGERVTAQEVDVAKGKPEGGDVQPQYQAQETAAQYQFRVQQSPQAEEEEDAARQAAYDEWAGKVDLKNYRPLRYYREISLSAGHGAANHDLEEPEALLFSKAWLRSMGLSPNGLLLVQVRGDSMVPALQPGWTVMIDTAQTRVSSGIYAITLGGEEMVKRLQRRPGGVVRVTSDNPAYDAYEITAATAAKDGFSVIGRVVWHAGTIP
jgi:phage repressor protein C with HTH and peptisase S24 domain